MIQNYHAIVVKYLPVTNYRPSRVKLVSGRFGDSVTLSYDYALNGSNDMAVKWLKEHGQDIQGQAEIQNGHDIIFLKAKDNTFTPLKEM